MSQIFSMPPGSPDDLPGVTPAPGSRGRVIVREDVHGGPVSWMAHGACRGSDPELFFPIAVAGYAAEQTGAAKAVCGGCEVGRQCLSYALRTMPHGIWGGTTREERITVRARPAARSPGQAEW